MELGVVGKPNVGKSTFFAAATLAPVQIANYPFTTIDANRGVAYVRKSCPHVEIGRPCKPNNAPCKDGTRLIPVELLDVAGLVPKAHEGR
ncbi:MAG TPA: GTPase, partial [Thermoplasmata archaeon]|nr:GTPase [Thermoplasmata archaeon]